MKKNITLTILLTILLSGINFNSFAQLPDSWQRKADIGSGGFGRYGAVSFSIGDKGYIGTGVSTTIENDFWEYDPSTDVWTQKADYGGSGKLLATGFSIGTKGYIVAGTTNSSPTNDTWEYDPSNNSWLKKADFPGLARYAAVGFSIGQKGYLGTGRDISDRLNDFWEYNPANDTWTKKADVGGPLRAYAIGFSIGTKGYIGTGNSGTLEKDFWEYDPTSDTWTQKADFAGMGRFEAVGFNAGSIGYIGAGDIGGGIYENDFWAYDPFSDTWTQKADFGGSIRYLPTGFGVGNKGYIGAGWDGTNSQNDFWEYTPTCIQPAAPIVGTITQPDCGTPYASVELSGLPTTGEWTVIINYPGGATTVGSGETTTITGLEASKAVSTYTVSVTDIAGCTSEPSNAFQINMNPNGTTLGIINGPASICSNTAEVMYSIEPETGFSNYIWSVTGAGWEITDGGSTTTVTITTGSEAGSVTVNADNVCSGTASSTIDVSLAPSPVITDHPVDQLLTYGDSASFTVSALDANTYQWQEDSGVGFTDITDGGIYSNATTATLNIDLPSVNMTGYKYRCVVTNDCGPVAYSDGNAVLTVLAMDVLIIPDADQAKDYGSSDPASFKFTFTPALNGTDAISGLMGRVAGEDAGDYAFTLGSLTSGANYSLSLAEAPTYIIKPVTLTITAEDKSKCFDGTIYSDSYTVTYNGFVNSEDEAVLGGSLIYGGNSVTGIIAGNYSIDPSGLISNNYILDFVSGTLVIKSTPDAPVITQSGDSLISNVASGNQWYQDGVEISGSTDKLYVFTSNGTYYSIVTEDGCSSDVSNSILILNVSTKAMNAELFDVYPNPSTGVFNIKLNTISKVLYNIEIYNSLGALIWKQDDVSIDGNNIKKIDLNSAISGLYTLVLKNKDNSFVRKIYITK